MTKKIKLFAFSAIWLMFLTPYFSQAHVKWFSDWSFTDQPQSIQGILSPLFIGLATATMVALAVAVFLDKRLSSMGWYQSVVKWFDERQNYAVLAVRIGLGMTFILAWSGDTLLSPDLRTTDPLLGWGQFVLALLLIFPSTTPLAGVGTLILYGIGISQFGVFYMLDYFIFVGVGVYLIVANLSNERLRSLRIPALYFSVGFSLMWLGIEKIVYPQWGLEILTARPFLTLGLDPQFFLTSAAFVELVLGYLLIIGLLERPIAIVVTLVFFTTTLIFGKVEVIGHTIIHAALIAFLLEGTTRGIYRAPINIHRQTSWRMAFAAINFALITVAFVIPYELMAQNAFNTTIAAFSNFLTIVWR
jgi:uncharacterized membrane protein YphA (DoxX/SURF4 family)